MSLRRSYTYARTIWVTVNADSTLEAFDAKAEAWIKVGTALGNLQCEGYDVSLEDIEDEIAEVSDATDEEDEVDEETS